MSNSYQDFKFLVPGVVCKFNYPYFSKKTVSVTSMCRNQPWASTQTMLEVEPADLFSFPV